MAATDALSPDHEQNRRAWDSRVRDQKRFTEPLEDDELRDPQRLADILNWLGCDIRGRRILCLAAGGGRHGVLYAAAGADATVVDTQHGDTGAREVIGEQKKRPMTEQRAIPILRSTTAD